MTSLVDQQSLCDGTNHQIAILAGGCFWCMEPPFVKLDGVIKTISGYTGGRVENPTYDQICTAATGHYEALMVVYDPDKISFKTLLDTFWRNIDPTQQDGQFADKGSQYKTAIFYTSCEQRQAAETSKSALAASGKFALPIASKVLPATPFYQAEDYHQQYFRTNPVHYQMYSLGSGRKGFIKKNWGEQAD